MLDPISWRDIKSVVFDFDGTIYDPICLWKQVGFQLWKRQLMWKHIYGFAVYLNTLEKKSGQRLMHSDELYALTAQRLGWSQKDVKDIVNVSRRTIFQYLNRALYPGFLDFFHHLGKKGIHRTIYSDEPLTDKLSSLNFKPERLITSVDPEVMQLKPTARALQNLMTDLNISAHECLYIGDRYEKDAVSAHQAGILCVILPKRRWYSYPMKHWYHSLLSRYG